MNQLKIALQNLPNNLFFNEKENDLYAFCNDCNKKYHMKFGKEILKKDLIIVDVVHKNIRDFLNKP